jgi:hypothetical protein
MTYLVRCLAYFTRLAMLSSFAHLRKVKVYCFFQATFFAGGLGTEVMADPEVVGMEANDKEGPKASSGYLIGVLALCLHFCPGQEELVQKLR